MTVTDSQLTELLKTARRYMSVEWFHALTELQTRREQDTDRRLMDDLIAENQVLKDCLDRCRGTYRVWEWWRFTIEWRRE